MYVSSTSSLQIRVAKLICAAILLLSFAGCSKRFNDLPVFSSLPIFDAENQSVGRFKTSYLAEQIDAYYRGNTNGPIAIATFADIDNLYGSSTFGRMLSEQLMSELTMRGYNVVEIRRAEAMQVMFSQGEFALSRESQVLRNSQDLSGLVVGTYVVSPERIYLNARLIDPATSIVVSAGSVEMSKTEEIEKLLRGSSLPPSLERIPVRHMGYKSNPVPYYWPYVPPRDGGEDNRPGQALHVPGPVMQNPNKPPVPALKGPERMS